MCRTQYIFFGFCKNYLYALFALFCFIARKPALFAQYDERNYCIAKLKKGRGQVHAGLPAGTGPG
jgi:hypothetical protein